MARKEQADDEAADSLQTPATPPPSSDDILSQWQIAPLSEYEVGFFNDVDPKNSFVCFADPSNYLEAPAWPLRNLLVLIWQKWKMNRARIICYRDTHHLRDGARSIIYDLESKMPAITGSIQKSVSKPDNGSMPKVVGWERNEKGKLGGKMANLTEYMDPKRLADQSVDLNLKLMKWRISPNLDLDKIKHAKCLLLGAGTLGSYVARNLLGWGVRKITFVDNGRVSYSNPVRQPLFEFEDCLAGGAQKATTAVEALKKIYPGVDAVGHQISVPMAGHPITDATRSREQFHTLIELFDSHDVVFLLMDTRESRWLPTVIGKAKKKIVVNAALGFDTFVVMRHGIRLQAHEATELGCYFCNDVVAPADSVKDQTLDQQCTVTRPGVAAIASAIAVELMISILQHPDGPAAPATDSERNRQGDHPLGVVPHQIRGFLSTFQNLSVQGKSYDSCSACSQRVIDAYTAGGWAFVERALNEKGYVEELSGLAEIQRAADAVAQDIDWDDADEGNDEGEGFLI